MCGEAGLQTIRDITCLCSVQTTSLCKYFSPPWRQRCNFQPPFGLVAPAMEMKRKQPREEIPTASKVGDHPFPSKYLSQDCIRFYYQDQDKGILQHSIRSLIKAKVIFVLIADWLFDLTSFSDEEDAHPLRHSYRDSLPPSLSPSLASLQK